MRKKVRVISPCVADRYAGPRERIVEFSGSEGKGGLISIREDERGQIVIEVYRADKGVFIRVGDDVYQCDGEE